MTDDFDKKLAKAREQEEADNAERARGTSLGMRIATELLAGVLVGFILGYYLDQYFETKPILLVVFILLGAGAGFLNIYRIATKED